MGWLDSLFGGDDENPAEKANQYLSQIPGATSQYLQPYSQAGQNILNPLSGQFNQLLENPEQRLNQIGSGYHESPGFQHALQQALAASGHAAAAGGMSGTPEHQYNAMSAATGLANQDYNNYLTHATGLYGQGLQGGQNLAGMGMNAGGSLSDMIAQTLASQGGYAYAGQAGQNQNRNSLWGNLFRGLGGAGAGFLAGGPVGAVVGGLGGAAGGLGDMFGKGGAFAPGGAFGGW